MIELSVSLASNGVVKVPGYEQLVRFGYTKNRGVYRLVVSATGEWEGLTIRAFWHVPDGKDPASSLVVDSYADVPASVTAQPGNGCITFEGSDGTKTVTSADLRYRVSVNSGTEDGTDPEPGTPAWQQLVDAVHTDATAAEQAKTDAQTAATESAASADKAAGSEKAAGDAQAKAAESLQELKDGIASGNFKGEPGTSPTVTVQDIAGGHRIVITDATGTSSVDVMDGKRGDPGKPGDTGATPELTIGTVEEGDAPSATITGTAKNPVLNLTLKSGAPGKDATVDATLSQSGKAADAKVTGDELARKAVIDDTAVGTAPWSSKHIVDMLCPPISETGNPAQFYPVAGYPLGCKVSWEPTQEGSGTPSPENIRPIKGRDSVTVTRCGENLFNPAWMPEKTLNNGLTWTITSDGTVTANGTANGTSYYNSDYFSLPAGTYTISAMPYFRMSILNRDVGDTTVAAQQVGQPCTFTVETDIQNASLFFATSGILDNVSAKPQIEKGTTATTYAPYTGQTATLTLPSTIYGGTVDAVTGEGQETWEIINLPKTGWVKDNSTTFTRFNNYTALVAPASSKEQFKNILCNVLPSKNTNMDETAIQLENANDTMLSISVSGIKTLEDFLSFLDAYSVQVCYKLKTPTSFTATGAQPIPTLNGVNTMLTDADSVTVTGRADPIKRITDLEDAVASMTTT